MTETEMTITKYAVTGLTCEHCAVAVTEELRGLSGVDTVTVDLLANATSTVTVTSDAPLTDAQVRSALDEAGDYRLA